ncbi:MAG: T9SS type A sorting domain-containing protein [Bacteroidetes bacterium]|nr:T9SS type A sorting domain-containing protein [Bacteroidota bacterium]
MKSWLLTLVLFLASFSVYSQSLLLSDDFTSANGTALTSAGWSLFTGTGNTIKIARADSSAMVSFSGYTGSGTGNAVLLKSTGQDIYKNLSVTQTNGSSVYASFIINVSAAQSADYFFSFTSGTTTSGCRTFIKTEGSGFNIGVQVGSVTPPAYTSSSYSLNTNYLVVVKYQLITGASNDKASVFIFPAGSIPSIEPSGSAVAATTTELFTAGISGVQLRQGTVNIAPTLLVDGIRVSADWATAVNSNVNSAPVLSTVSSASVTGTTATLGATLTSYGWVSSTGNDGILTERGIVWATTANPTIADTKVSGGSGVSFTVPVTGLPGGTKVYYRGYATNSAGTAYSAEGFIFTEPLGHVTELGGTVISSSAVDLTWSPVPTASGYLVLSKVGSDPTGLPSDGTAYTAGATIGDATVAAVVSSGAATGVSLTGLSAAEYHFTVVPFGYDGAVASTYNYKTDGTIPAVTRSTILGNSDLAVDGSFTYSSTIDYSAYQSDDITSGNSVAVMGLLLRDGGAAFDDSDLNPTTLISVSFAVTNPSILRKAALYSGSTELSEVSVSGSPITFSGLDVTAADDSFTNLTLRVTYQFGVTDNTQNQFTVTSVSSLAGGSGFASGDGGAASSSVSGDINRIEVTASACSVFSQPALNATFYVDQVWGTSVVIHSVDANGNLDSDFSGEVTLTPSGSGSLSGNSVSAVSGIATFSSLTHNTNESIQLTASSGGLLTATTNTFTVVAALQQIGVTETFTNLTGTAPNYTGYDNSGFVYTLTASATQTILVSVASTTPVYNGTANTNSGRYINFPPTSSKYGSMTISNINTTGLTNLNVTFGYYQASVLSAAGVTTLEWSADGTTYNSISLASYLPSGIGWATISNVPLPQGAVTANLRLRFKVDYATQTGGVRIDDVKIFGSNALASEPTVITTSLDFSSIGNVSMTASWSSGNGQKRLVLAKSGSAVDAVPADGSSYSANAAFGLGSQIGSGNFVVYSGSGSSVPVTGLSQNTTYHYAVFEFNGSGTTANYLTSSSLTGSMTTLDVAYASNSDAMILPGSESLTISSLENDPAPLSVTDGAQVFAVQFRDGGGSADFDVLPTLVDSLVITESGNDGIGDWSEQILTAAIFDGTTRIAEAVVSATSLKFTFSSPVSVADGGSKILTVRISLKSSGILDRSAFGFELSGLNVFVAESSVSSQLTEFVSETAENTDVIEVTGTRLVLTGQPTDNAIGTQVFPVPEVTATDDNGNQDGDFNLDVTVTSNHPFDPSSLTVESPMKGVAAFGNLVFDTQADSVTLTFTCGALTPVVSGAFMVYPKSTPVAGEILITQSNRDFDGQSYLELVNTTSKYFDLSELSFQFLSGTGVSLDVALSLSGVAKPNRYILLGSADYLHLSETDSIKTDGILPVTMPTDGQIGLFGSEGSVHLDGLGFGDVSVPLVSEGAAAEADGVGFALVRKVSGTDSNINQADFKLIADSNVDLRNQSSFFFGSGSSLSDPEYTDLWIGGPVTSVEGFIVTGRLGLESGLITVADGSVLMDAGSELVSGDGWILHGQKWNLSGNHGYTFAIGDNSSPRPVSLDFSQTPDDATELTAVFSAADPGQTGLLPETILGYYSGGSWQVSCNGSNSTGTASISVETSGLGGYIIEGNEENYTLLQRADSGSEWQIASETVYFEGTLLIAENVTGLGEFTIGEIDPATVPVEFAGLTVSADKFGAKLAWATITETANSGFTIEKRSLAAASKTWEAIGTVAGKGTTTDRQNYLFIDKKADQACEYRLSQLDMNGKKTVLAVVSFEGLVTRFEVAGNYPNPFNPETTILFRIPEKADVSIVLYNNLGQRVKDIVNRQFDAGSHEVIVNGSDLASGVYYYEVNAGSGKREVKKMVLLK